MGFSMKPARVVAAAFATLFPIAGGGGGGPAALAQEPQAETPLTVTTTSQSDFSATLQRLTAAIEKRELRVFAVIDHAAGAASVGETLRPTTLVIFGNPAGGTPMMQSAQTMGFDLPLKALVWDDAAGATHLAVTDIKRTLALHGADAPGDRVATLLGQISREATSE